ncbi:hypothetical protein, partial [Sulfuriferula thiophila]|uniref:hypothetical protein n=1 Tax=Sulfuriferula thiophila TaxID=1781211 RepID=UPI001CB94249
KLRPKISEKGVFLQRQRKSKGLAASETQRSPKSKTILHAKPKLHNGQSRLTAGLDLIFKLPPS